MDRTSPAPDRPRRTNRSLWPFFAAVAVILFILVAVFGERGIVRELQYRRQKDALAAELRTVEEENRRLRQEIEALRSNGRYVEAIARKELGMVKPDEIIYQFPAEPNNCAVPAAREKP